jgi:hypothetical protein
MAGPSGPGRRATRRLARSRRWVPGPQAGQAFSAVAAGLPSASTPSTRCAKTLADCISNAMVPQTGNAGIRLMAGSLVAGVAA